MHKCINNSIGNVYHLEQFVSDFFPYSQKQLGFDKPVTIRFESDQDNAGVMLGKTAYYDPESMEIVLYIDGRHPKDVMRSLSHELVHHAQNCRGDFTGQANTGPGYAQEDPHLRKMEREAYTKGNLIFRDFEDLIKTGKINIEIDFSDSGEPKMSLKEWKDNEINTKLMKKWGFLNENKEMATEDLEDLEEGAGAFYRDEDEELEEADEKFVAKKIAQQNKDARIRKASPMDLEGGQILQAALDFLSEPGTQNAGQIRVLVKKLGEVLAKIAEKEAKTGKPAGDDGTYGGRQTIPAMNAAGEASQINPSLGEGKSQKISVREARKITRRIIERVKKENK
jgi:hypothetical protein